MLVESHAYVRSEWPKIDAGAMFACAVLNSGDRSGGHVVVVAMVWLLRVVGG